MLAIWRRRLVDQAKQGNAHAFASLLKPELAKLYRVAYYLARNTEDSRDLVQAACLKAFLAMGDFKPEAPLGPWLHRILRNQFLDDRKAARHRYETPASDDQLDNAFTLEVHTDTTHSPLEHMLASERQSVVLDELRKLPDHYAEVLVYCDIQDLSYDEVAEILGVALGTVKSRLSRARVLLRERLVHTSLEPLSRLNRTKG